MKQANKRHDGMFIYWELYSIEPMSADEAMAYQSNAGYIPAGYNFEKFKCEKSLDSSGKDYYQVSWRCYASCD